MRVAVVGAGVSGLVTAKVLRAVGHEVVVFESRPDIGGVWSATRRYPGLGTQNDKGSYSFSDHRMPESVPEYPSGAQVQDYLVDYARTHDLVSSINLETTVVSAAPLPDAEGWSLEVESPDGSRTEQADWLVLANGICSLPHVPELPGREEFERAGGAVLPPSEVVDPELLVDRDVVVLGWGKSAADLAVAAVPHARSVTVVARRIDWKLPWRIGRFSFQQLVMTRIGEHLIWAPRQRRLLVRLVLRVLAPLRRWLLRRVEHTIVTEQELDQRDLRPVTSLSSFTHLMTPGFFEAVDDGRIDLHRAQGVAALRVDDGHPSVEITDATRVPASLVVAATGFDQDLGLLSDEARTRLLDDDGDLRLYRHTLPERLPRLAFVGWHNSFRSPLGAEVQALWLAAMMAGLVAPPSSEARRHRTSVYRLQHRRADASGQPMFYRASGTIPDLDAWIAEAGLQMPWHVRLRELVRPVDPRSYSRLHTQLERRLAALRNPSGTSDDSATSHGISTPPKASL